MMRKTTSATKREGEGDSGAFRPAALPLIAFPLAFAASFLLNLLFAYHAAAQPSTDWIADADTCEDFQVGVTKFYSELQDLSNLPPEQSEALDVVLDSACSKKFQSCDFVICRGPQVWRQANARSPEPLPPPSATPLAELPQLPKQIDTGSVAPGPEGAATARVETVVAEPIPAMETPKPTPIARAADAAPLSADFPWLKSSLSCKQLLDEVKKRYSPYDRTTEVGRSQRSELKRVLKIICSEAFQRCNFAACRGAQ